jgi:hypothetical protein
MKLDKVKFIDIEKVLGNGPPRQRIAQLGIEVEGGWGPKCKLSPETRLVPDGSVHVSAWAGAKVIELERLVRKIREGIGSTEDQARYYILADEKAKADAALRVGELPSPILSLKPKDGPLYWPNWLRQSYPSHVNETCGLHVHESFARNLTYQRFMDPTYPKTIIEFVRRWAERKKLPPGHPIWPRLAGQSEYCQHTFYATEQAKEAVKRNTRADHHRPGSRYSVVNYCWLQHHTFEVRLLPMFEEVSLAEEAIQEIINISNAYLFATRKREETISGVVQVDGGEFRARYIETL